MNGSTIGEHLGWRLATQFCAMQWIMEGWSGWNDDGVAGFRTSEHGRAMLVYIGHLRQVLWPEPGSSRVSEDSLAFLRRHYVSLPKDRYSDRETGTLNLRSSHSLLRQMPRRLDVSPSRWPHVMDRLAALLDAGKSPAAALACHVEHPGHELSDGLRVPHPDRGPRIIREHVANLWRTVANDLPQCPPSELAILVDAGEAAASLLLAAETRMIGRPVGAYTPDPAAIAAACDRLIRIDPDHGALPRLRAYAGDDRRPLTDALSLRADGPVPEPGLRERCWRGALKDAVKLRVDRGEPVQLRIGPEDRGPRLGIGMRGF